MPGRGLGARSTCCTPRPCFPTPAQAPAFALDPTRHLGSRPRRQQNRLGLRTSTVTTIGGVSPVPLAEYVLFGDPRVRAPPAAAAAMSPATGHGPTRPSALAAVPAAPLAGRDRRRRRLRPDRPARSADWRRRFGMKVVGVSAQRPPPDGAEAPPLARLRSPSRQSVRSGVEIVGPRAAARRRWAAPTIVVVVVPLTPETPQPASTPTAIAGVEAGRRRDQRGPRRHRRRGRPGGGAALSGAVGGAVLDVFDDEPLPPDSAWWDEPNVLRHPARRRSGPALR